MDLKSDQEEEMKKLQKQILDKYSKGENIDELYQRLQFLRSEQEKYA